MNTIIIIGAVQAFYLSFLLFSKNKKIVADKVLTLFLLLLSFTLFSIYYSFYLDIPDIQIILVNSNLLFTPFFFVYFLCLTNEDDKFLKKYYWHFLPFALSILYYLSFLLIHSESEIDAYFYATPFWSLPVLFILFTFLDFVITPIYIMWTLLKLKQHQRAIENQFSSLDHKDLRWIKFLAIGMLCIWIVNDFMYLINYNKNLISEEKSIEIGFAFNAAFIFYIGYFALKQTAIFVDKKHLVTLENTTLPSNQKYEKSGLKQSQREHYKEKLLKFMKNEKPFLDNEFSLQDLSEALDVSKYHLSQIINESFEENFYTFVNKYRVEEFIQLSKEDTDKTNTLLSMALGCGFNSKSSFNRYFKKYTGQTPSQYLKKNKKYT